MLYTINVPLKTATGNARSFDLIPALVPGVNGRQSITGVFQIAKKHNNADNAEASAEYTETTYGRLVFINENFFEWRYEGNLLNEQEVHQLVDHVQNHAEEILKDIGELPDRDILINDDAASTLNIDDDLLDDPEIKHLQAISPYFLYGSKDNLIAIVKNSSQYDILIDDVLMAKLDKDENDEWRITWGELASKGLFVEIIRRIEAINNIQ
jgi:hypothetical protein